MCNEITIYHSPEVANTVTPYMAASLADHYQDRLKNAKTSEEHHFLHQQLLYYNKLSKPFFN
jgi:hypothetical protein